MTALVKHPGARPTAPIRQVGLICLMHVTRSVESYPGWPTCAKAFCSSLRYEPLAPSTARQMIPRELVM